MPVKRQLTRSALVLALSLRRERCPGPRALQSVESLGIHAGSTGQSVASERYILATTRGIRVFSISVLLACAAPASAVTLDQVLSLKKAGVTDAVVLALIERDH